MYCSRCHQSGHLFSHCEVSEADLLVIEKRRKNAERVKAWREKNREKYNDYQREYMRGRRG